MRNLFFMLPLLMLACVFSPAPGSQKFVDINKTVYAFEDLDEDGKQDKDETPLANALVVTQFNQHGMFFQQKALTDENGEATITGTYTHFFDVSIAAPCGYRSTGEARQSATGKNKPVFGFISEGTPESGKAQITFTLWQDADENGLFDPDELPLTNTALIAVPQNSSLTYLTPDWGDVNAFWLTTDGAGQADLDLGSSCGDLLLRVDPRMKITGTQPEAAMDGDVASIPYKSGEVEIQIGVKLNNP